MLIDCDSCPVAGRRCPECVVTAVVRLPMAVRAGIDDPPAQVHSGRGGASGAAAGRSARAAHPAEYLDAIEHRAVAAFVHAGLVSAEVAEQLRAEQVPLRVGRAVG